MPSVHRFCLAKLILLPGLAGVLGCESESSRPPRQAILFLLDAARPCSSRCRPRTVSWNSPVYPLCPFQSKRSSCASRRPCL